jgi:hypothetical protein
MFTWTAESSYSCKPKFCVEKLVAAAQVSHPPINPSVD